VIFEYIKSLRVANERLSHIRDGMIVALDVASLYTILILLSTGGIHCTCTYFLVPTNDFIPRAFSVRVYISLFVFCICHSYVPHVV
jgi:hypothetical protein